MVFKVCAVALAMAITCANLKGLLFWRRKQSGLHTDDFPTVRVFQAFDLTSIFRETSILPTLMTCSTSADRDRSGQGSLSADLLCTSILSSFSSTPSLSGNREKRVSARCKSQNERLLLCLELSHATKVNFTRQNQNSKH